MKKQTLLASVLLASLCGSSLAATLQFSDKTTKIPGFQFFTKGADVASSFEPITGSFTIPDAPGKDIPVNTNMQVSSCTDTTCTKIGYPGGSVGWSATSYTGQYSFWYGVDSSKWSYKNKGVCVSVSVDGNTLPSCCSDPSSWKNCHVDNVNFDSGSNVAVTLTSE